MTVFEQVLKVMGGGVNNPLSLEMATVVCIRLWGGNYCEKEQDINKVELV